MSLTPRIIQFRRGPDAGISEDPVLREGEPGYATDLKVLKVGDGVTPWSELSVMAADVARDQIDAALAAAEATDADRSATGEDRVATGEDRVATGEDRVATGEDRVQTGLDRAAASGFAGDAAGSAMLAQNVVENLDFQASSVGSSADASALYDPGTGRVLIEVPRGEDGASFTVDARGPLSERGSFDAEPEGFSYLATDTGDLYFREGASGWGDPLPFRGPPGPPDENALQIADNLADLASASTARTNLGLGNAAVRNVTSGQFDAAGDGLMKRGDGGLLASNVGDLNADALGLPTRFGRMTSGTPDGSNWLGAHISRVADAQSAQVAVRQGTVFEAARLAYRHRVGNGAWVGWAEAVDRHQNLADLIDAAVARDNLGLGSGALITVAYESHAAFVAATVPLVVNRAAFVVGDHTFHVLRDTTGPIEQANGQKWKPDGPISPQHFGDCGNDPARDDAPFITQALAYTVDADNRHLHFPAGWYFCRTLAEHTYSTAIENNTQISGEGLATRIVGANHLGAIRLVNAANARRSRFHVSGIHFVPAKNGAGCSIEIRQSPGGAELGRALFARDLMAVTMSVFNSGHAMWHPDFEPDSATQMWGANPAHGDYDIPWPIPGDANFDKLNDSWADDTHALHPINPNVRDTVPNCVSEMAFIGMGRASIENVIIGEGGPQKPNKTRGYATLNLDGSYNVVVSTCARLNSYNYFGVTNHRIGEQEGGRFLHTNCVAAEIPLMVWQSIPLANQALGITTGNRHPVFNVINSHFNGRRGNMRFYASKYVNLINTWNYAQQHHTDLDIDGNFRAEPPNYNDEFVDIMLIECHACSILNPSFRQGPHPIRDHIRLIGSRGIEITMDENSLNAQMGTSGYVVNVDADCEDVTIRLPSKTRTFDFTDYLDRRLINVAPGAQGVTTVYPTGIESFNDSSAVLNVDRRATLGTGLENIGRLDFSGSSTTPNSTKKKFAGLRATSQMHGTESERGRLDIEALEGTSGQAGMQAQLRAQPAYANDEAGVLLRVRRGNAYALFRVKVGANGTGPGGVGAALYIDNA